MLASSVIYLLGVFVNENMTSVYWLYWLHTLLVCCVFLCLCYSPICVSIHIRSKCEVGTVKLV